ncbi:MAG: nuclease, partial [Actinobacteria bacterium]|nr:nuclease [Actinomycetota bacterium]
MRARWLLAAVLGLVGCRSGSDVTTAPGTTQLTANATIERVVDGDTVVADFDGRRETVRLIGIDTPETVKPDAPVECFGPEASA